MRKGDSVLLELPFDKQVRRQKEFDELVLYAHKGHCFKCFHSVDVSVHGFTQDTLYLFGQVIKVSIVNMVCRTCGGAWFKRRRS